MQNMHREAVLIIIYYSQEPFLIAVWQQIKKDNFSFKSCIGINISLQLVVNNNDAIWENAENTIHYHAYA